MNIMGVTLQRLNVDTGALYGNPIVFGPFKSLGRGTSIQNQIQAIPQGKHILVPLGDQGPTITPSTYMHTETSFAELRKWWPSQWYVQVTASTFDYDMPVGSIWLLDDLKTLRGKGYMDRWDVMLQLTREWAFDTSPGTPLPFEPTTPTLRSDDVVGVTLEDIETSLQVTIAPYQIEYTMKGQKEIISVPAGHHIQIPLGCEGPYISMDAHMRGDAFDIVKDWDGPKISKVVATSYAEFDVDTAPTYYSRWIVSNVQFKRSPTQAAAALLADQWWDVSIGLVRYWDWELI